MIYQKILAGILLSFAVVKADYSPVPNLQIDQYLGRWYQVYKDLPDDIFEGEATCAIADYSLKNETTINVLNSQINRNGKLQQIQGIAYYEDNNTGGELTVQLANLSTAPYWVIDLGPVEDNQYQYSIVSDDSKLDLFVLTRNVTKFYNEYDKSVLEKLDDLGFNNFINKPIKLDQSNCSYP